VQQYGFPAAVVPNKNIRLALFDGEAFANELSVNFLNERPYGVQVRRYESGVSIKPNALLRKNHRFPGTGFPNKVDKTIFVGNAAEAADDDPIVSEQGF
jgi:hypothetical protein